MIKIKKGLDLPISGKPQQVLSNHISSISRVAVTGFDYIGLKPTMHVKEGDVVKLGTPLFSDKKTQGVTITAPAAGTVVAVNRGERRVLESVVIAVDAQGEALSFGAVAESDIASLSREQVVEKLSVSGLWAALRNRPFSRVPATDVTPSSIFVTAIDTNPLAADPQLFIKDHKDSFVAGLGVLKTLCDTVYLCTAEGADIPSTSGITHKTFGGKHPAGNVGTHIHFLDPVSRTKTVWHIGYADVVAFGKLFTTGQLFTERYVSVAGPQVDKPQIIKTRVGASLDELTAGLLKAEAGAANRVISGSVWNGRTKTDALAYLGRYHTQVTVLTEGTKREFMGWLNWGRNKYTVKGLTLGGLFPKASYDFTTTTNGSERAMVPLGQYESVMPLDVLPTQLLRALVVGDIVNAMDLGCLELDEEDVALCSFVCSGKYEYGPILRDNLTRIERET